MASIAKRPDGRWRARYREDGGRGRERSKHFDKKSDAQRFLDEIAASVVTGQYVSPTAGQITLKEYAETWRKAQPHRATTRERTENQFRNQVYPTFGDRALSDILPSQIQAWVTKLATPEPASAKRNGGALAPTTIAVVHGVVSGVFAAAVRDRRIVSNPCVGTRLPKPKVKDVIPMTVEQVAALTGAMPPHIRAIVTFAAGTGVRQGEAFGLTLDRIDFLRRQVRIDRQLQGFAGKGTALAPPRSDAGVRTIPLPEVIVDALAAHVAANPVEPDGLVFTDQFDKGLRRGQFGYAYWKPAAKATELPASTTFHDLRHFYASLLIRHGESVKTVQARLGHASASETLDTYSHLWPDSADQTRHAVDAVFGKPIEAVESDSNNA